MASIPACHAGDRGSIPRRGVLFWLFNIFQSMKFENFQKLAADTKKEIGAAHHQERSRSVWLNSGTELKVPKIDGEKLE